MKYCLKGPLSTKKPKPNKPNSIWLRCIPRFLYSLFTLGFGISWSASKIDDKILFIYSSSFEFLEGVVGWCDGAG